jgi:hypothetical protein
MVHSVNRSRNCCSELIGSGRIIFYIAESLPFLNGLLDVFDFPAAACFAAQLNIGITKEMRRRRFMSGPGEEEIEDELMEGRTEASNEAQQSEDCFSEYKIYFVFSLFILEFTTDIFLGGSRPWRLSFFLRRKSRNSARQLDGSVFMTSPLECYSTLQCLNFFIIILSKLGVILYFILYIPFKKPTGMVVFFDTSYF